MAFAMASATTRGSDGKAPFCLVADVDHFLYSLDWFKGKSTGNHRFSHFLYIIELDDGNIYRKTLYLMVKTHGFPVNFPLNQSSDILYSYLTFE